jgi:hypothetical protein
MFSFFACQEKKKPSRVEITTPSESKENNLSSDNYSVIFQAIMKSDKGMMRGVSIGDDIEKINETTLPSETPAENGRSFTEYFDDTDLNFADVLYLRSADNKVAAISVDVYIEGQTTVDNLMGEFKTYFSKKYGKGIEENKSILWKLADGENDLVLQNVSTDKDPGLKILFAKKGDKSLL